ncbi:MAG: hypothetical protein ACTSQ2_02940 [Candidatus Heimdallarchaeaceae archaeon]
MEKKEKIILVFFILATFFVSMTTSNQSLEKQLSIKGNSLQQSRINHVSASVGAGGEEQLWTNIIPNGNFEDSTPEGLPERMDYSVSSNSYSDLNYQALTHNGLYSGYSSCEGSPITNADNNIYWAQYSQLGIPNLAEKISLDFWWNTVANPDISNGGTTYFRVRIYDPAFSQWYNIYYYLSASSFSMSNSTYQAYFDMIKPLASWQHLTSRNVTNDFEQAFGSVSSTVYIYYINFHSTSPHQSNGFTELVIDDVNMQNDSSFNYFADNGDFEKGTGSSWDSYNYGRGEIGLSDDSIEGSKSLNLTSNSYYEDSTSTSSISYAMTSYEPFRRGYYPSSPGMVEINFDWKYTDVVNGGNNQFAYFYLVCQNESYQSYYYWFLGTEQNEIPWSNYT